MGEGLLRSASPGQAYRWLIELDTLLRTDPDAGKTPVDALHALADWLVALPTRRPRPASDWNRDDRWMTC